MELHELTKVQVLALRHEIVLNSLYLNDYSNSFEIDKKQCWWFFDGYVDYLWEIATDELDYRGSDFEWVVKHCDNKDNLWNWFDIVKGGC